MKKIIIGDDRMDKLSSAIGYSKKGTRDYVEGVSHNGNAFWLNPTLFKSCVTIKVMKNTEEAKILETMLEDKSLTDENIMDFVNEMAIVNLSPVTIVEAMKRNEEDAHNRGRTNMRRDINDLLGRKETKSL
jgi:hypothetical protein